MIDWYCLCGCLICESPVGCWWLVVLMFNFLIWGYTYSWLWLRFAFAYIGCEGLRATRLMTSLFNASFPHSQCRQPFLCVWLTLSAKSLQLFPTLCDPVDCSLPGSSIHGIFQVRKLECFAILDSLWHLVFSLPEMLCLSCPGHSYSPSDSWSAYSVTTLFPWGMCVFPPMRSHCT